MLKDKNRQNENGSPFVPLKLVLPYLGSVYHPYQSLHVPIIAYVFVSYAAYAYCNIKTVPELILYKGYM